MAAEKIKKTIEEGIKNLEEKLNEKLRKDNPTYNKVSEMEKVEEAEDEREDLNFTSPVSSLNFGATGNFNVESLGFSNSGSVMQGNTAQLERDLRPVEINLSQEKKQETLYQDAKNFYEEREAGRADRMSSQVRVAPIQMAHDGIGMGSGGGTMNFMPRVGPSADMGGRPSDQVKVYETKRVEQTKQKMPWEV